MGRSRQAWLIAGCVAAMLLVFFGEVLVAPNCYYPGDIARIYYPQRVLLSHALERGRLPWWVSEIGAGYPLLAEGEVGALYPLNWIVYRILPVAPALVASIVVHYALSALGMVLFVRRRGLSVGSALLAGLVWTGGGFMASHLSHISSLSVVAWMPWMLLFSDTLLLDHRPWLSACALALVVALQFLAGHAQMSLLALIVVGCYALVAPWMNGCPWRWRRMLLWAGPMALGALVASPQLLASAELGVLSQRGGGLEGGFFTSYSFHPLLLATYVSPFALGNPYPEGSIELMVYVGLLPLVLSVTALASWWRTRSREVVFWATLAVLGVLLSFGRWNPLYAYLQRVPILNLFRVPARYQLWTSLSLTMLAAMGLDRVLARREALASPWRVPTMGAALTAVALALIAALVAPDADALAEWWRWLPLGFGACSAVVMLAGRRVSQNLVLAAALIVVLSDLYTYGAMLDRTYNATWPIADIEASPALVGFLEGEDDARRLYTKQEILPILEVQRGSLYPNMASGEGVSSANLYLPLTPVRYQSVLDDLSPWRLDRLGVTHYAIPQLLPVDEASELYDVQNPFSEIPVNQWIRPKLPDTALVMTVDSYTSHSAAMENGTVAAVVHVRDANGTERPFPLRLGFETAEWAYERPDVLAHIQHTMAPVATTWPARSGFPAGDHVGHTYRGTFYLTGIDVEAMRVEPVMPEAFVRVEQISLELGDGSKVSLGHAAGKGNHTIVYRSEDVMVYRNHDAWPRAYTVTQDQVKRQHRNLWLDYGLARDDLGVAEIVSAQDQSVTIVTSMDASGYVVLADLDYPGWTATVDGRRVAILAADGVYRGVALSAGEHIILFEYAPTVRSMLTSLLDSGIR